MVAINNTGYSSIKIFCDSKNATVNLSSSRKIWTLQSPIVLGNNTSVKMLCSVESCSVPLAYYQVNETNNNFSFNGTKLSFPVGNYSALSFVTTINSLQSIFSIGFNKEMSKFSINAKAGRNTIEQVPNSIYKMMGVSFPTGETYIPFGTGFIAQGMCNLVYTSGIYVSLNNMSNSNIDTGSTAQSSTCLLRIPISQPSNTYLQYFNPIGFKTLMSGSVLSQVDISLLDDNRNLLQLAPNCDWVIVLRVDFERIITEFDDVSKINKLRH